MYKRQETTPTHHHHHNNNSTNRTAVVPVNPNLGAGGSDAHVYAALKIRQLVHTKLDHLKQRSAVADGENAAPRTEQLMRARQASGSFRVHREVSTIRRQASAHRKSAVQSIKARQLKRRETVQARVQARNKAKRSRCLQACPAFASLDEVSVDSIINVMDYAVRAAGDVLCEEGGDADRLFVIVEGTCDVSIRGERVAQLHELDVFGEGALFDEARVRSATVTVAEGPPDGGVRLLELERATFDGLVASGTLDAACVAELRAVGQKRQQENAARDRAREMSPAAATAAGSAPPVANAATTKKTQRTKTPSQSQHPTTQKERKKKTQQQQQQQQQKTKKKKKKKKKEEEEKKKKKNNNNNNKVVV